MAVGLSHSTVASFPGKFPSFLSLLACVYKALPTQTVKLRFQPDIHSSSSVAYSIQTTADYLPGAWKMRSSVRCCSPVREFAGKTVKLCFCGACVVVCLLTYTTLAAFIALVGGTIGAIVGSLIWLKPESRFLNRAAIGTVVGVLFSVELFKVSIAFFLPEGNRFCVFGPLFDAASVCVARKLVQEWYSPAADAYNLTSADVSVEDAGKPRDSDKNMLKTRISRKNLIDSSGNRACCPVCLQDFEFKEVVRKLPCCHNMFHQPCIDKWLHLRDSCPLCRCTVIPKKLIRV